VLFHHHEGVLPFREFFDLLGAMRDCDYFTVVAPLVAGTKREWENKQEDK
jgi:hypothetical protein